MISLSALSQSSAMSPPLLACAASTVPLFGEIMEHLESDSKVDRYRALQILTMVTADQDHLQGLHHQYIHEIALLTDESLPETNQQLIGLTRKNCSILKTLLQSLFKKGLLDNQDALGPMKELGTSHTGQYSSIHSPHDVIRQLGKIVPTLWKLESDARSLFHHWAFRPDRPSRSQESHLIHHSKREADRVVDRMIVQGLIARSAAIPRKLVPQHPDTDTLAPDTLYWTVSRSGGNTITRILKNLRSVPEDRHQPQIQIDEGSHGSIRDLYPDELEDLTKKYFGQALGVHEITAAFYVDAPGFRLRNLLFQKDVLNRMIIIATIETDAKELIGSLSLILPTPPEPGKDWIVEGNGFYIPAPRYQQKQIGRKMRQRLLASLHHLGVDTLELLAGKAGAYAWPRMGFDFADEITRETMIIRFLQYLWQDPNIHLSPDKKEELLNIRHAWELVEFKLEDERPVGQEFLENHGLEQKKTYRMRFWLDPNYPGWIKLLKGHYPPEWDHLPKDTRDVLIERFTDHKLLPEILLSDEKHARWILDRIQDWTYPIIFYLQHHKKGGHRLYPQDFIEGLQHNLYYLCEILKWMINESRRKTELGRFFWQHMNVQTRLALPVILESLEQFHAEGIQFTRFVHDKADVPHHHPSEWNQLTHKTRQSLLEGNGTLGILPDNYKEHAQFLIAQLDRWMTSASEYLRLESQRELHSVDAETLFSHYDSLYGITDVMKMIQQAQREKNPLAHEFWEQLDRQTEIRKRLSIVVEKINQILGRS